MDDKDKIDAVCVRCGTKEKVTFAPDPFNAEILEDDTPVWLCITCRIELSDEI